jgi:tetratricopeptide (TPR) repeat protein
MPEHENIDNLYEEGQACLDRGDFDGAIECFSKMISLCPEIEGGWGNRGYALYEIGRDEEALDDFNMVISLQPDDPLGYAFQALVLRNFGRYEEALEAAVNAIECARKEEDAPPAYLVRGWLFIRAGQYEAALEDLESYIRITPEDTCAKPMLDICRLATDSGRACPNAPEGVLDCPNCQYAPCEYSFNTSPNPNWEEQGGKCMYQHCIKTMPYRNGDGEGICPWFGHDCPGGEEEIQRCDLALQAMEEDGASGEADL